MIGLSTYAFFWQLTDLNPKPFSLADALDATKEQGIELFQICDYVPLEKMSQRDLSALAAKAKNAAITIELGTKGVEVARLAKYLSLSKIFGARLVRSTLYSANSRPTLDQAIAMLKQVMPAFEDAGITLALETYEQVSTADLIHVIEQVASPNLGICLDPANVVARLEKPKECIEATAPMVKNIHAKDFAFSREDGWVGFKYSGAPMGQGLHDYGHLLATVKPREKGINEIVEHWLPMQKDIVATIALEKKWTQNAIEYLRSIN